MTLRCRMRISGRGVLQLGIDLDKLPLQGFSRQRQRGKTVVRLTLVLVQIAGLVRVAKSLVLALDARQQLASPTTQWGHPFSPEHAVHGGGAPDDHHYLPAAAGSIASTKSHRTIGLKIPLNCCADPNHRRSRRSTGLCPRHSSR